LDSSPGFLRRALTRTSVGNEKYEDENEDRDRARVGEPYSQCELGGRGRAAGAVAVRHETDPNRAIRACQHLFSHMPQNRRRRPHSGAIRMAIRPDAIWLEVQHRKSGEKIHHEGTKNTKKNNGLE
jgi:hypothetical protein